MNMDIRVPKLADGFTGGTVVAIQVKEGQRVKKDDIILEMETEKAVGPIPSPVSGVVEKIHVKQGAEVAVGQVLMSVREQGPGEKSTVQTTAPASVAAPIAVSNPQLAPVPAGRPEPNPLYHYESKSGLPPPASPSLRRLAEELGIDLVLVPGSGPGGRIEMADIKAYIERLRGTATVPAATAVPPESVDFSKWGPVTRKPLSSLRRKIGQSMTASWTTIPQVTQFDEADATRLNELREKYKKPYEQNQAHLTVTVIFFKALAELLKKHPIFNSGIDEVAQEIVERQYCNIGMAVDTPQGLIVPVIKDVDKKSCLALAKEIEDLAGRTKDRKVSLDELQGGCLTLSNQGGIGGAHFTPIIRKPESAILGVGRAKEKAVVLAGKTAIRWMIPLSLTHDHRLIDGADAVRFLKDLVELIENFDEAIVKEGLKKPTSSAKTRRREGRKKQRS
jgi:pyruvate dehydrogenase E2 component (dihydrolipoamide acetyltransferase)